jgi:hypothetical protein
MEGMKKFAKFIGFLVAIMIFFFLFDATFILWQITPITNISKYQNIKTLRWYDQTLIEHFPEKISSNARSPRFYYRAGFMQSGSTIELRVQMPVKDLEEVYARYRPQAKAVFNGADKHGQRGDNQQILPKWYFMTFPTDENENLGTHSLLPIDFEILLLSAHPYKLNPMDWNHGQSSGIGISRHRREIIYWAEVW